MYTHIDLYCDQPFLLTIHHCLKAIWNYGFGRKDKTYVLYLLVESLSFYVEQQSYLMLKLQFYHHLNLGHKIIKVFIFSNSASSKLQGSQLTM